LKFYKVGYNKTFAIVYKDRNFIGRNDNIFHKIANKILDLSKGLTQDTDDFIGVTVLTENRGFYLIIPVKTIYKIKRRFFEYKEYENLDILITVLTDVRDLLYHLSDTIDNQEEKKYKTYPIVTKSLRHNIQFKFIINYKEDYYLRTKNFVFLSISTKDEPFYLKDSDVKIYIPERYGLSLEQINKENKILPITFEIDNKIIDSLDDIKEKVVFFPTIRKLQRDIK